MTLSKGYINTKSKLKINAGHINVIKYNHLQKYYNKANLLTDLAVSRKLVTDG